MGPSKGKWLHLRSGFPLLLKMGLHELGAMATDIRNRHNEPNIVTYAVDRNINYTNICISQCRYCAFFRKEGSSGAYVLDKETLIQKLRLTKERGGTHVLLQGGLNPRLQLSFHLETLRTIREHGLHVHGYSPPELIFFSRLYGLPLEELLKRLVDAGLGSIPGGGAEILSDRVRKAVSPKKATTREYLMVMETAHKMGIKSTATMMFGHVETWDERFVHLKLIRELQERTNGFTAFIPWPYQPWKNDLPQEKVGPVEYLRVLAISRIVLDNIPHIQASWVTQGRNVSQVALFFGADDMGSTMMEENVVSATGLRHMMDEDGIRDIIRGAGFLPQKRDVLYRTQERPWR